MAREYNMTPSEVDDTETWVIDGLLEIIAQRNKKEQLDMMTRR